MDLDGDGYPDIISGSWPGELFIFRGGPGRKFGPPEMIKDKDVKFVDFRFTDTKGKMQHVTAQQSTVDEGVFADGYAFDGSSIAGWKGIESSDMLLMPDPATAQARLSDHERLPLAAQQRLGGHPDVVVVDEGV